MSGDPTVTVHLTSREMLEIRLALGHMLSHHKDMMTRTQIEAAESAINRCAR